VLSTAEKISPANAEACECFTRARQALHVRDFAAASELMTKFRRLIRYDDFWRQDNRKIANPVLSVVIVAYQTNMDLIACIKSVLKGTRKDIEIIVVDNGGNEQVLPLLLQMPLLYIRSPMNVILSEGRNIGVYYAQAPICAFLDDDALVRPEYAESILAAFRNPHVQAIRGRIEPKNRNAFQGSAWHYNLGPKPLPSAINTEGNSAWRTGIYKDANGMDPLLFGHEGTDLSVRLERMFGSVVTFYWPTLLIHHDYAMDEQKRAIKDARHALMEEYLGWKRGQSGILDIARPKACPSAFAGQNAHPAGGGNKTGAAPLISVLLPAWNAGNFLAECVQSILRQSVQDFEILIIDDGSTDNTADVIRGFSDQRIRYHKNPENRGLVTSLNLGLQLARGKYIASMDADDVNREYRFAAQVRLMEENPQVCVCGGSCYRFGESSGNMIYPLTDVELKGRILFYGPFPHPFVMLRADFFKRNAVEYSDAPSFGKDYELWLRLAHGYPECLFANVPYSVGGYRTHTASISALKKAVAVKGVAAVLRPYLEKLCGEDVSESEAIMHSELCRGQFGVATPEEWLRKKQWLIRIREANERKPVYHPLIFRKSILRALFELCKANLWLGPWVVKQLAAYEDAQQIGIPKEVTEKLYAAAAETAHAMNNAQRAHCAEYASA
jgi:glycosyltransferase involved in cell wall biosynthesis